MKKFDVVTLGELLIDFTDNGKSAQGNTLFEANPGGAPCNVLAMLNRLGHPTAFIGKVGKDIFGLKLKAVLEEVGIDTSGLIVDEDARTTLAFVQTFADGDRDSQSAKDRVDESEGAKKADEDRAEDEGKGSGIEAKIDALISRMDKLVAAFEKRAEMKEDRMERAAEKYGLAPSGAGEAEKKSFTDEDVKKLLG